MTPLKGQTDRSSHRQVTRSDGASSQRRSCSVAPRINLLAARLRATQMLCTEDLVLGEVISAWTSTLTNGVIEVLDTRDTSVVVKNP
jgi:hypothetical protein